MKKELSETMQECKKVLEYLQNHEQAVAFLEPVDWEAYGLMDYPSVIKHPMDLGTVEQKLQKGQYKEDVDAFARDGFAKFVSRKNIPFFDSLCVCSSTGMAKRM